MYDLWTRLRSGLQPQSLRFSFEKAGLTVPDQPVPWSADLVCVEAHLRLHGNGRRKADFQLRIGEQATFHPDSLRRQESDDRFRLLFRFPPPGRTSIAELLWRGQRLGQLTIPVVGREDFLDRVRLQVPTLFVRLDKHTVACQTFVSTQCRGLVVGGLLSSPTSLCPIMDLGLRVEVASERGGAVQSSAVQMNATQLMDRQALVSVVPRRLPRRLGSWLVTWYLGERPLATQRVRAISARTFQRSLRVIDTRFIHESKSGRVHVSRQPPSLVEMARSGPCFLVSSSEPGMAGVCRLSMKPQSDDAPTHAEDMEHDLLITDGPTMFAPGTFDAADLVGVTGFELSVNGLLLGALSTSPIPIATFNGEGAFRPAAEFSWSPAAEEELNDRLGRLLDDSGGTVSDSRPRPT